MNMLISVSDLISSSDSRIIPRVLWNPHVHCLVHKNLLFVRILAFLDRSKEFVSLWICGSLVWGLLFPNLKHSLSAVHDWVAATVRTWRIYSRPATRGPGLPLWHLSQRQRDRPIYFCVFIYIRLMLLNRNLPEKEKWSHSLVLCHKCFKCPLLSNSGFWFV